MYIFHVWFWQVKRWYTTKMRFQNQHTFITSLYSCTFKVKTSIIFFTWVILLCKIDHSITICCLASTFYIPFLYFLLFAYIYSCRQNRILQYMHVICTMIYGWDKTISVEKKPHIFYIYINTRLLSKDSQLLIGKLTNKYKYYGVPFINSQRILSQLFGLYAMVI